MNKFLNLIYLFFLVVSCKPQNASLNTTESQNFIRVMGKKSWGFVNQDGDTIIPLNKYKFLNPIDDEGMILVQSNGKSGYINIEQDTLIPFIYDDLSVFSSGLAPAKKNGKYGFIDRKGKVVIPFEYETESHFYKSGLAKAQKNNKSGFIDKVGNVVIPLAFEKVRYNKADKLVCAMKNGKWAFFSGEGKQLTEFEFDQITESPYSESSYTYFESGLCLVMKNGKQGYIDSSFQTVIPFGKYEECQTFDLAKRAVVKTKGRYGLIDINDKFVLEPKFESIEYFSYPSGRYKIMYDNKYGIVDSTGQEILPTQYLEIAPNFFQLDTLRKGILILKRNNGKSSVTDYNGKVLIPEKYDDIGIFEVHENVSYSVVRKKGRYGLINHLDEMILPVEYDFIQRRRWFNYLITKNNGLQGLYSKNGKEIFQKKYEQIDPCHYDEDERFIVKQNNLFGVIDINENVIIPFEYQEISNWVEYGPKEHFVTKNGKKGLVSRDGEIVIPTQYDEVFVDNSKLIKVKNNGLYGTVDWNNKIIHPIKYEHVLWEWPYLTLRPLDTIYVEENDKYFSTDTNGKIIEPSVSKKLIDKKFGYLLENE